MFGIFGEAHTFGRGMGGETWGTRKSMNSGLERCSFWGVSSKKRAVQGNQRSFLICDEDVTEGRQGGSGEVMMDDDGNCRIMFPALEVCGFFLLFFPRWAP